jgi:uncharacterized protein (TIGR02001 family)
MNNKLLLLAASIPFNTYAALTADLEVVSDYRSGGVSNSDRGPALQSALNYSHDSGIYASTWATNVDYAGGDKTNLEWDFYLGFYKDLNPNLGLDIGYASYTYHGADYSKDYDYAEIYLGVVLSANTKVYWNHTDDYFGSGVGHDILKVSYDYQYNAYLLNGTLGYELSADKDKYAWDENKADYQYIMLSAAREYSGFMVKLTASATTIDTDFNKKADPALVLSVKRSFDLM